MTFLHPWAIALSVAAAGLPLVIHWLTRPRPARMPLSTLRFVREVLRQRRARHRLRDFVILALRTAAVLLLAWAIARPQWGERPLVSDRQAGDALRVVILDVSQSMAAAERGIQAIERARTVAAGYLRYRPGLRANLILAGAAPRAVFEESSTNFDALRDALARCEVQPQRMDVRRALALAGRILAPTSPADARRRELVVVSDFQRSSWAVADFSPLPADVQLQLESVAPVRTAANLAILGAEARTRGSQSRRLELAVEVGNFSPVSRQAAVEVELGGATYRLKGVVPGGRRGMLLEEIEFRQTGWQSGQARLAEGDALADDALAADNARPMVVQVRSAPVYALVTRQPAGREVSSSRLLECALAPDARLQDPAAARVVRLHPANVDRQALAAADLILLDHPGKLSSEATALLAGLVGRGRAMLYVAGESIDATNLKQLGAALGGGLRMPVEFAPPLAGQARRDLFLAAVRRDDPPFQAFGDNLNAILGRLRFSGGLSSRRLETGLNEDVLATYSDGTAAMVLSSPGAGAMAVINADLAASNLPRTAAFVPLLEELVNRMLSRNRPKSSALCGEPLVANLPAEAGGSAGLRVVGPAAAGQGGEPLGELTDEGLGAVWRWPAPTRPGVYRIQRDGKPVFALAVAVAAEESQLESLPPQVLKERLAGGRDVYFRSASSEADRRDDVWKWLIATCVACMLGEVGALLAFRT